MQVVLDDPYVVAAVFLAALGAATSSHAFTDTSWVFRTMRSLLAEEWPDSPTSLGRDPVRFRAGHLMLHCIHKKKKKEDA